MMENGQAGNAFVYVYSIYKMINLTTLDLAVQNTHNVHWNV